jgi:hypothetical protein
MDAPTIDNTALLSPGHDPKLIYDPLEITPTLPPFSWMTSDDWEYAVSRFKGGPAIKVTPVFTSKDVKLQTVLVNKLPAKSTSVYFGRIPGVTEPAVCHESLQVMSPATHTRQL